MSAVTSSNRKDNEKAVYFHPAQIKYIEELFPERVIPSTASEAELREYMGTRRVVHVLRGRVNSDAG